MDNEIYIPKGDVGTAIRVMTKSKAVADWVDGMAVSYGIDKNTPAGKQFYEVQSLRYAKKLVTGHY